MALPHTSMDATDSARRARLPLDILAVLASIVSYWCSLQRYGIYDYFDGIRYMASGIALLVDGTALPVPIAYHGNVSAADFIAQDFLSYPSLPFQLWVAVTTGLGALPLVATSLFAIVFYIVHNIAFARLARQFLPLPLALAALALLCFAPSVFVRTMTRPLPDSFLCMAFTLGLYLAIKGRPMAAGLVAGLGSIVRFQGLLFVWSIAIFARDRCGAVLTSLAFVGILVIGTILLSVVSSGLLVEKSTSNFGFYLSLMSADVLQAAIREIPQDLYRTALALLSVREFVALLLFTPVICLAIYLTPAKAEKTTLALFLALSFYICLVSYHTITVTIKTGHDARYIAYIMPLLVLAVFISAYIIATRLNLRGVLTVASTAVIGLYALSVVYYAARMEPLWTREYLPDSSLSFIGPDKLVALATAEEAASELYIVTKASHLMMLPEDPAEFTANDNSKVDYLVIGGWWNSPYSDLWTAPTLADADIIDAAGNRFSVVLKSAYYTIYDRKGDAN